jgi:hypothetical protein
MLGHSESVRSHAQSKDNKILVMSQSLVSKVKALRL